MAKIVLQSNASGNGTLTISAPSTNTDFTLNIPAESGSLLTSTNLSEINVASNTLVVSTGNVVISGNVSVSDSLSSNLLTAKVSQPFHQAALGTHLFRGADFSANISANTNTVKIFPATNVGSGHSRPPGSYWGGISFMHLDPEIFGGSYTGAQMWIGGKVVDLPGQERSSFVIATNESTTANTHPIERVIVDPFGRVQMPYQPSFLVTGTNYTQTSGGTSKIIPSSESFDIGGNYDLANGRFTAPVSGVYLFGFFGLSYPHSATSVCSLWYYKNGSGYGSNMQFGGNDASHAGVAGGITVNMSVNDYVELFFTSAGSTTKAYSSQWNMYGYLIG